MNSPLLRRRYGHGAARLPLAMPSDRSLARQASARVAHEEIIALTPTALIVGLAMLATWTGFEGALDRTPTREPIQITEWKTPIPAALPETAPPRAKTTQALAKPANPVEDSSSEALAASDAGAPAETHAEEASAIPFTVPRMRALTPVASIAPTQSTPQAAQHRRSRRPGTPNAASEHAREISAGLAGAAAPGPSPVVGEAISSGVASSARLGTARPKSRASRSPNSPGEWSQVASADLGVPTEHTPQSGDEVPAALRGRRAPAVAAPRPEALSQTGSTRFRGAGWEEVPLEQLPDCSPPGRQDQLKQSILRASTSQRECAAQGQRFRFVETRNLGAFLMWTQGPAAQVHAASDFGSHRRQDACFVLEAALRCLTAGAPSSDSNRPERSNHPFVPLQQESNDR